MQKEFVYIVLEATAWYNMEAVGYFKHSVKGVTWIGSIRIVTRGIALLRTVIVVRILNPAQFGLFGIAMLLLSLMEILTETGINVVLMQEREEIDKYIDSAWVVSIIRGIIIALVIALSAPFVASFFHSPAAVTLVLLVALVPFIRGFINPAVINFQKNLEFHKQFLYETSVFAVESVTAVVLVVIFKSPSSLIWSMILAAIFQVIISFVFVTLKPKISFEKEKLLRVFHRGKWVTASGIFDYIFYNADNVVVGRLINTTALGFYDMAYTLALLPITEVANVVAQVTFPLFTKIAGDKKRLLKAYLKTTAFVAGVTIPAGLILIIFPSQLISLVLGDKWLPAVPVLQVLTVFGVVRSLTGPSGSVFLAYHKQKYISLVTFIGCFVLGVTIVPFVYYYGLIGAGLSAVVASLIQIPFLLYLLIKLFKSKTTI